MTEINNMSSVKNGYFNCSKCLVPLHEVTYIDYQNSCTYFHLSNGKYHYITSSIDSDAKVDIANFIIERGPIKSSCEPETSVIEMPDLEKNTTNE